jgi:drug/metabolite transporter (DMT)-like permease
MHFPLHLLGPLASSLGYVIAMLLVKRSADYGVGIWRTTFISNLIIGLCFAPLWLLGGPEVDWSLVWQPLLPGALFFVGQIFTFLAQTKGDVSIATPVMGIKVLMVALASTLLLSGGIPLKWWIAAALSTLGVVLLSQGGGAQKHQRIGLTITFAAAASGSFALADVLIQKWSPHWGPGRFPPLMFGSVAVAAFGLIPFFREPLSAIPRAAWKWLVPGAVIMAVQAAVLVLTISIWGDATSANIIYSSRGLWSVIAVWLVGHWFNNQEQHLGSTVLRWRLSGAAAMLAAIVLVVT